jgi:Leucine-rich repeat (LRR) protein
VFELLDGHFFDGLHSLTKLHIEGFTLFMIVRDSFKYTPCLESIHLINNIIGSIEPGAFQCVPKLRRLEISSSQLKDFPPLNKMPNLEVLKLHFFEVESLDGLLSCQKETLPELNTRLRVLNLSKNKVKSLQPNMFAHLASLEVLDLSNYVIKSVPSGTFSGLVNLQHLFLDGNKISSIDLDVFNEPDLTNLRLVDLNSVSLRRVEVNRAIDREKLFTHFWKKVCVGVDFFHLELGYTLLAEIAKSNRFIVKKLD